MKMIDVSPDNLLSLLVDQKGTIDLILDEYETTDLIIKMANDAKQLQATIDRLEDRIIRVFNMVKSNDKKIYEDEITDNLLSNISQLLDYKDWLKGEHIRLESEAKELRDGFERVEKEYKELRDGINGLVSEWVTKGQNVRQIFPATPSSQQLEWQWKECANELESLLKGEK